MLTSEQAQKELEKTKVATWQMDCLAAIKKLPARLGKVARPLVGVDDDGAHLQIFRFSIRRQAVAGPFDAGGASRNESSQHEKSHQGKGGFHKLPVRKMCVEPGR